MVGRRGNRWLGNAGEDRHFKDSVRLDAPFGGDSRPGKRGVRPVACLDVARTGLVGSFGRAVLQCGPEGGL